MSESQDSNAHLVLVKRAHAGISDNICPFREKIVDEILKKYPEDNKQKYFDFEDESEAN